MFVTLEEYLALETGNGHIDFTLRAHRFDGNTTMYIRPTNLRTEAPYSVTTPLLVVKGDHVLWPFPERVES